MLTKLRRLNLPIVENYNMNLNYKGKIICKPDTSAGSENTFVTNALTQNENHLQKLFSDQGISLEFSAHDESKYFGSKNSFNKNPNNNDQSNSLKSDNEQEQPNILKSLDDNVSSRHIVNVIA